MITLNKHSGHFSFGFTPRIAQAEITKLQQHLSLLKEEYTRLQDKYRDVEGKYNALAASSGSTDMEDNFAFRLLKIIASLYDSTTYSDLIIALGDCEVHAHRFVLSARSDLWNEAVLKDKNRLDWKDIETEVGVSIIKWMYTDAIDLKSDELTVKIIRKAFEFGLNGLVELCERFLINGVNVRTCVKFYSVAEEINANRLREYCSGLISAHWDDLNTSDFEHMSGPLLYKMLKNKTQLPLHAAVRLQRDDVVYLCLLENASRVSKNFSFSLFTFGMLFYKKFKHKITAITIINPFLVCLSEELHRSPLQKQYVVFEDLMPLSSSGTHLSLYGSSTIVLECQLLSTYCMVS